VKHCVRRYKSVFWARASRCIFPKPGSIGLSRLEDRTLSTATSDLWLSGAACKHPLPEALRPAAGLARSSEEWGRFYQALFIHAELSEPASNQVMRRWCGLYSTRSGLMLADKTPWRPTGVGCSTSMAPSSWHSGHLPFSHSRLVPLQLIMHRYRQTGLSDLEQQL